MSEDKKVEEESQNEGGSEGKSHPETVSWTQYIGLKEKFNRTESDLKTKVGTLEEQLKQAPNPEEFKKVQTELAATKAEHKVVSDELKATKERSISEKRTALVARGVPAEKVKDLSEKELDAISGVLGVVTKSKPDFGGGGGGSTPVNAKERMKQGFQSLHPN